MKLFKDAEDNIFAYEENGTQDYLIGDKIALTQSEIDARNAKFAEEAAKAETIRNSALAKLTALGLSEDEVKALVG